jgi:regulator of RNase E activity RraA
MEPLTGAGFYDLFEAFKAGPKPAVVVLQEIGGHGDYAAHCGEVMATIFTRLGAIGLVSDCGVRDVPEVRAIGMHYFARGKVASHAHFRVVRAGIPVQILGLPIRPGELIHGDENGLMTLPDASQQQMEAAVNQVRDRERALMDYIRSEQFTLAGLRGRFLE